MLFRQLFDAESSTYTYLIADLTTCEAILVDPVLAQVKRDCALLAQLGLTLRYCLETHVHSGDPITGSQKLRNLTGALAIVPLGTHTAWGDGHIQSGEMLFLGEVAVEAISTPGHTHSHNAYLINTDRVLTGDALLIRGCGRTDLQSGDAGTLYDSVTEKLFTLPDKTWVYPAHDNHGNSVSTIGEEKRWNPRFAGRDRASFIEFMADLALPKPEETMEAIPIEEYYGFPSGLAS